MVIQKVGTPLMQCSQTMAIDLPQKMLVMEDAAGDVWIVYNDPAYLKERHNIGNKCDKAIKTVTGVLDSIAKNAAAK